MKYIDMHCDTITHLLKIGGELRSNNIHIDINKLRNGECMLQNFAIFTNIGKHDFTFTDKAIDFYYSQMNENFDSIRPIYKYSDIDENERNGYISSMLTLEEGSVVDGKIEKLNYFYDKGVRMITLTWNYKNSIGHPNIDNYIKHDIDSLYHIDTVNGLTDFGVEFVKKCNELGIIVDISHASDKTFYDVLKVSTKPIVASHSNARSVAGVSRNMSDDMIKQLAANGGVMGLNYCAAFINTDKPNFTYIEDMVKHIDHIVEVGGIDCIGLGSDFDGIDCELEIKDAAGVQMLYKELKKKYSEEDIEKIFYKNVLRVYKQCLK